MEVGQPSEWDAKCKSGSAGRMDDNNSSKTFCCPEGKNDIGSRSFCDKVIPDGQVCHFDKQCKTGKCFGSNSGTKEGVCGKLDGSANCKVDRQCKSGDCCHFTNSSSPTQCRPDGWGKRVTGGFDVCWPSGGYGSGTPCRSDNQCKSDNCKGNGNGTKNGKCT